MSPVRREEPHYLLPVRCVFVQERHRFLSDSNYHEPPTPTPPCELDDLEDDLEEDTEEEFDDLDAEAFTAPKSRCY